MGQQLTVPPTAHPAMSEPRRHSDTDAPVVPPQGALLPTSVSLKELHR